MAVVNDVSGSFELGQKHEIVWSVKVKGSDKEMQGRGNTEYEARTDLANKLYQIGLSKNEVEGYLLSVEQMFGRS